MIHKIQIICYLLIFRLLLLINAFCFEINLINNLSESVTIIETGILKSEISNGDITEVDIVKHSCNGLPQYFPCAVISEINTICNGETTFLSVRLVQGTPQRRFSYSRNGKKLEAISEIIDNEYILKDNKEDAYMLTSIRDPNRSGIFSGEDEVIYFDIPSAALSGGGTVCEGTSISLRVDLTGTAPWSFSYKRGIVIIDTFKNVLTTPKLFTVN